MSRKEIVNPKEFLNVHRIDLVPKIWYLKNKQENINANFFIKMYLEHIRAFNQFNENHKKTKEDFLRDFDKLINSIKKEGFKKEGAIPSTKDSVAIDGAHRIASSIYLNKKIYVEKEGNGGPNYNYKYFKKRGLSQKILEEIIFRYFQFKKENIYACIFWGSSFGKINKTEIEKELKKNKIELVYCKKVELTERGKKNLIISCYENEPWMNHKEKDFSGAIRKVAPCFKGSNKIMFYVLESDNKEKIINFKKNIREKLNMGNHSIHSSDSYEETRNLCNLLLNKNSLFFMNYGEKMALPEVLENEKLKDRIDFVITSSYIMEMFGLRKAGDIDYINDSNEEFSGLDKENIKINAEEIKELIYNPKYFFRFKGIKFLSLDKILEIKKKKEGRKNKKDVLLIEKFLNEKKKFDLSEKIFLIQMKGVSLVLKLIKKIPQEKREKIKQNKFIMGVYKKLFC
jgi:hypothetical protein